MATNTAIKFFKGNYGSTAASTKSTENVGGIVFDNTSHQIFVGGVAYGGNITDVTFANSVLTITKATGAPVTLDFSDTASASATFEVFQRMNEILGVGTDSTHAFLDYTGTTHISTATTLVDADKKLDAAITAVDARIDAMDATNIQGVTATDTEDVIELTLKGVTETDGVIAQGTGTDKVTFAKVAKTGEAEDVTISSISASSTATNVQDALEELANQITAGDVSIDSQKGEFTTDSHSFVTISSSNKKLEVKLNSSGYITKDGNGLDLQHVDTAGNSTTDTDLATVKTVATYISSNVNALDVTGYEQGSVSGSEIKIYGIKEDDGKISHDTAKDTTIVLGSNYDANSNKVALQSNITDEINKLDVDTVQAVTYTAASGENGAKLTFTGIKEEDGKIAVGTGNTELTFAKVATSGTAADVAISDAAGIIVGTNVEDALQEIARKVNAAAGGMRFNGAISNTTATLNGDTHDIRPGDIYLAGAAITIGTTSVEAGDMIIYTGTASNEPVTLTANNCSIVERETDVMVTSAADLVSGQIVLGSGGKEVAISTITEANLLTAMANANSALQSIGNGTDGQYVTTTITTKDTNNTQNVSVALTTSTVTSTATTLSGTNGVLTNDAIAPIKSYIDAKVGSTVENLDASDTVTGTNISFEYKETDGVISIGTMSEKYATIEQTGNATTTAPTLTVGGTTGGLVKGTDISTVKTYIDNKVGYEINQLDADITSDDAAVAKVEVKEVDGKINDVIVTTVGADVTVSTDTTPNLAASTATGAVTGADIAKIKQYVDAKADAASQTAVSNANATIPVGTDVATVLGTVAGTAITAKASFTWEEYA